MSPGLYLIVTIFLTHVVAAGMVVQPVQLKVLPPAAVVFTPQAGSRVVPADIKLPPAVSSMIDQHGALADPVFQQGAMVSFQVGGKVVLLPQTMGPKARAMIIVKGSAMPKTMLVANQIALQLRDHLAHNDAAAAYQTLEQIFDVEAPFPAVRAQLLKAPFLQPSKYGQSCLRKFSPATGHALAGPILLKINNAAAVLQRAGEKLSMKARLFGPLTYAKEAKGHMAFLAVFESQGQPAGFSAYVVKTSKEGETVGDRHATYFDKAGLPTSGIADALLEFTASTLGPALGVKRELLQADYAGRYVWAKKGGFQFDPNYRYYDIDGKTYKSWEMAQRSLARFLKANRIRIEDLRLRGKPVSSLEALTTPADFALLEHRQGRKIRVQPLVMQNTASAEEDFPVGKAFMLKNYKPAKAPYVLSQGGALFGSKFAQDAMPWWRCYRNIPLK